MTNMRTSLRCVALPVVTAAVVIWIASHWFNNGERESGSDRNVAGKAIARRGGSGGDEGQFSENLRSFLKKPESRFAIRAAQLGRTEEALTALKSIKTRHLRAGAAKHLIQGWASFQGTERLSYLELVRLCSIADILPEHGTTWAFGAIEEEDYEAIGKALEQVPVDLRKNAWEGMIPSLVRADPRYLCEFVESRWATRSPSETHELYELVAIEWGSSDPFSLVEFLRTPNHALKGVERLEEYIGAGLVKKARSQGGLSRDVLRALSTFSKDERGRALVNLFEGVPDLLNKDLELVLQMPIWDKSLGIDPRAVSASYLEALSATEPTNCLDLIRSDAEVLGALSSSAIANLAMRDSEATLQLAVRIESKEERRRYLKTAIGEIIRADSFNAGVEIQKMERGYSRDVCIEELVMHLVQHNDREEARPWCNAVSDDNLRQQLIGRLEHP